jgi:hypothetical protein
MDVLTVGEIKRRGMTFIEADCGWLTRKLLTVAEKGLRYGPVRAAQSNQPAVLMLSEGGYQALCQPGEQELPGMTALQWLVSQPPRGHRTKGQIDQRPREVLAW